MDVTAPPKRNNDTELEGVIIESVIDSYRQAIEQLVTFYLKQVIS